VTTEPYTPESSQPEAYGTVAPQPGYAPQGYAPQGYAPQPVFVQAPAQPGNGLGVAGFVTGLLGLLFCWVPVLGIILALLGVIMGGVGIPQGKKKGAPTGLSIAGLVLGIIALIPAIIIISAAASIAGSA
jgi:hypothetical protein